MRLRVRFAAMVLPLAAGIAAGSCGLDKLTSSNSGGLPASLDAFAITGDSVLVVGDSLLFSAKLPPALVSASGIGLEWTSDNPTIAEAGPDGRVRGRNPGTTNINGAITSPSLGAPAVRSLRIRVRYNSIGLLPIESINGLGGAMRLWAFGNNKNGTRHSFLDPVYSLANTNDTAFVGLGSSAGGARLPRRARRPRAGSAASWGSVSAQPLFARRSTA